MLRQPPVIALPGVGLFVPRHESPPIPALHGQRHPVAGDIDTIEALLLVTQAVGSRGPRLDDQRRSRPGREFPRGVARCAVVMAGQQQVDAGIGDGIEGQFLPPHRLAERRALTRDGG